MNHLKFGEVVYLENDNAYAIALTLNYNGEHYVYLSKINDNDIIKIGKEVNNNNKIDLEIINNYEKIQELTNLFKQKLIDLDL